MDELIRGFIVKAGPSDAVDVIHKKSDVFLIIRIQAFASGQDISNELMILFDMRLLPGSHRILAILAEIMTDLWPASTYAFCGAFSGIPAVFSSRIGRWNVRPILLNLVRDG